MENGDSVACAITLVPFHGDSLQAIHQDGRVWVPVKRVCETLGIAEQRQAEKLKDKPWAVTTFMVATAPDGRNYEMFCLDLDSLPMWLATIEPSRVKEGTRIKLARYQKECARVLRDHFFGPREPVRNALQMAPAYDFAPVIERMAETQNQLVAMFNSLMQRLDSVTQQNSHITAAQHRMLSAEVRNVGRLEIAGGKWPAPARLNGKKYDAERAARADLYRAMRDVTDWGGKGKPWCTLPAGQLENANAVLKGRRVDAQKALAAKNSDRQLKLVGLTDVAGRGNDGK